MTPADLLWYLRRFPHAVQASVAPDGAPQAALVGVAVTDALEVVFDTLGRTRKASNLRANPRIALVLGGEEATVQYEGLADEPAGEELQRLREIYFRCFPDRRQRDELPDLTGSCDPRAEPA